MSRKQKRACTSLNYIEHFLILPPRITGCVSIFPFVSIDWIATGIMSFPIGLKITAITTGIEKPKPIIKKKKKKKLN